MKHKYIESLLSKIQLLETKTANLKKGQSISFSFFKESFKLTQEIALLLHELEFVQIEGMKEQMEKLVMFLSETESSKEQDVVEKVTDVQDSDLIILDKKEVVESKADVVNSDVAIKSEKEELVEEKAVEHGKEKQVASQSPANEHVTATSFPKKSTPSSALSQLSNQKETIVDHLGVNNKSLNDIQPTSHTIQDARRSISLNDRFLFQRELFDNNREAMNAMLANLQPFSSYDAVKNYLEENTDWNFADETVDKFLQMLKDSFSVEG